MVVVVRAEKSSTSHAVFVFTAKTIPISDEADIEVESVMPIDSEFK
jgi:hypothetical protein